MRILLYEHLSGGGLAGHALPPALLREGWAMRQALLQDLLDIPDVTVWLCHDRRLPLPPRAAKLIVVPVSADEASQAFQQALRAVDAAWLIAPESDGVLAQLSQCVLDHGKRLLGAPPGVIALCADKYRTTTHLAHHGITVVPTQWLATTEHVAPGQWIVKPNGGVGGEATYRIDSDAYPTLRAHLLATAPAEHYVVQPYYDGAAVSVAALLAQGRARFLSYNRMHVRFTPGKVCLDALTVNAPTPHRLRYQKLLERIAQALPDLWGYVGIDLIATQRGEAVLEINPRLTLSYCGLRAALGWNVAAAVLRLARGETLEEESDGKGAPRSIEVNVENYRVAS